MVQRTITVTDVRDVLITGETIETYPDDTPYPSRLVLGWRGRCPLHVVVADNMEANETVIITAYEPDPEQWDLGFRRRRHE